MNLRKSSLYTAFAIVVAIMGVVILDGRLQDELIQNSRYSGGGSAGVTVEEDKNTPKPVRVDVLPESPSNSLRCDDPEAVIPVAILTTEAAPGEGIDFDAATVDPLSVRFGPGRASEIHGKGHVEDVDGDGVLDLVLHFRAGDARICDSEVNVRRGRVKLRGRTVHGKLISGYDAITTVP